MQNLKHKLSNNEFQLGSWITLAHPAIAEMMCNAGFDWIAVDLEHSVITIREAEELIRIISLGGATPLVRLTSNDSNQIKRVMDAGSQGIIVPLIKTEQDAKDAINAVYFPPKGERGVGLARAQGYGPAFKQHHEWMNDGPVIIVQIEHIDALDNLDAIFSLQDIDGYIIGPYDLSASMGMAGQFGHPDVLDAISYIHKVARAHKKPGGMHLIEPDPNKLLECKNEGFTFVAYSLDIRMLDHCARMGISAIEEADVCAS